MDRLPLLLAALAGLATLALLRADRELAIAADVIWRFVVTTAIFLRRFWQWLRRRLKGERGHGPELVRAAFEDLGPTYIKLGQIIASSHGLFPEAYCLEFQKCLDRVRPFAFAEVEHIVEAEVGRRWFASIDAAPLASASIAQVHAARLLDGSDVVIKIQRPHIERRVEADVRILGIWGWALSFIPTVELANPVGIIEDFRTTIREELDFRLEAANMDQFNSIMAELGHADVRAPRPYWRDHALTTKRLLTMSRLYGVRVDDVAEIRKRTVDPEERLILGLRAWFQCLIFHGFFHGDVHAGNLMLLDDNGLGFLDFGIIGRFPPRTRRLITDYILAFATGDYGQLARVLVSMDAVAQGVDLAAMARDLERAYAPMLKLSFGDIKYNDMLPNILRVSVKHRMRLPREFVLVTKQMLYFDRYAKLLAPRLNIFSDPRLIAGVGQDVMRAQKLYGPRPDPR